MEDFAKFPSSKKRLPIYINMANVTYFEAYDENNTIFWFTAPYGDIQDNVIVSMSFEQVCQSLKL